MKRLVCVLASLVLVAAACGGDGDSGGDGAVAGGGAKTAKLTFGVLGPTSGAAAAWGIALDQAAELFVKTTNDDGGLEVGDTTYTLDHITYDHRSEAGEAATATERLVFEDEVDYIVGNAVGATCEAAQTITEREGVLFTFVCWGRSNLSADKPLSFRTLGGPDEASPLFYSWIADEHADIDSVALIAPNDQSGVDTNSAIKDAADANGIEVVASETYERGTTEYSSVLTRILGAEPDMIDLSGSAAGDGALILRQLQELGYDGQLAWTSMLDPQPVVEAAGAEATEGLWAIQGWDLKSEQSPKPLRDFAARYEAAFGEPATLVAAAQYASFEVITEAMKAAGTTDPEKVARQIAEIGTFEDTVLGTVTITGKKTYGINRQFAYTLVVTEMQGGKPVGQAQVHP